MRPVGFRRHDRQDLAVLALFAWALWALGPVLHLAAHEGAHVHLPPGASAHPHAHAAGHGHSHADGESHEHAHAHPHDQGQSEDPAPGHSHGVWDPSHLGVVSTPAPPPAFVLAAVVALRLEGPRQPQPPSLRRWRGPVMAQAP